MKQRLTEPNLWPVLNDLRKTGGCLIYDGDGYRAMPTRAHVPTPVMTDLLGRGFIRAAPDSPAGVYRLTEAGRNAWLRAPDEVEGLCDVCRTTQLVHPARLGQDCIFLCGGCATRAGDALRPEADHV